MSGPTYCRNHTLYLILLHGINVDAIEILQQSDDISDLLLCILHLAKVAKLTPCYKYVRPTVSLLPLKIALLIIFLISFISSES